MRIALLGRRSATWVIALQAISWLGASVLPLDPAATASELCTRTNQAAALVIIDSSALGDPCKALRELSSVQIQIHIESANLPRIVRDLAPLPPRSWGLADERALLFTSGSGGAPKPVALHTAQLLFATLGGAIHLGHHLGDTWHACLPPWHIGGLAILLRTTWYQTTLDLGLTFCASAINSAIDRGTLTQLSLVPAMLRRLLEDRGRRRFPQSLRWILLGGAAADETEIVAAEALGATICPTWGMTESAAQVATRSPAAPRRPGSVGPPLPFADIKCDPETGNLCISGPQVGALGPTFRTQDLGEISPKGQVIVRGRIDRVVISGGRNIDPAAVERILLRHPAVAQALVLGLPDPRLGEQLVAVIAPRKHAEHNLARFAAANLHPYDWPRRWALVHRLPTTAAGKISATTRSSMRARLLRALDLDADPERPQTIDKCVGGGLRTEAGELDEGVLMLDTGVDNIVGIVDTLDIKADPQTRAPTLAEHTRTHDRNPQTIAQTERAAKISLGVHHRQAPALGLHGRKPGPERPLEGVLPGVVTPLKKATKERDAGGIDLGEADDVNIREGHPGDLRPDRASRQGTALSTPPSSAQNKDPSSAQTPQNTPPSSAQNKDPSSAQAPLDSPLSAPLSTAQAPLDAPQSAPLSTALTPLSAPLATALTSLDSPQSAPQSAPLDSPRNTRPATALTPQAAPLRTALTPLDTALSTAQTPQDAPQSTRPSAQAATPSAGQHTQAQAGPETSEKKT